MDTDWFAVDADGRVAVLRSGALGHAPEGARDCSELLAELWRLRGGSGTPPSFYEAEAVGRLSLFCYEYSGWGDFTLAIGFYARDAVPEEPVHVDQLPPTLRAEALAFRFEQLRFSAAEPIQPLDFYPCDFRYKESRVAYLGSDERTVKPLPGWEEKFPEFCEEFRRKWPEQAQRLRFEAPDTDQGAR
jgi:hypothetical protein